MTVFVPHYGVAPRREGLAFSVSVEAPALPVVMATLLLRWIEVGLMAGLILAGTIVVHYRRQIATSWLVGQWAPAHLSVAAGLVTALAFLLGWVVAVWKKK